MDPNRNRSARRWSAVASVVLVTGAVLVAVIASGAARAEAQAMPSNTVPPTVSGTPAVGQTLTANAGTWTGTPTSFSYRWWRCSGSCTVISGATGSSYAVAAGDAGSRLMVGVVASNGDGPSPEAIRVAAGTNGLPVDQISQVNVLDPYFYGGKP